MLVSRVRAVALLIIEEYQKFKVKELLEEAISYCANKTSIADSDFRRGIANLQLKFSKIINETEFNFMDEELKKKIESTKYVSAVSGKIARYMASSLNANKGACISAAEVSLILQSAEEARVSLGAVVEFSGVFDDADDLGDSEKIHIELKFPRRSVGGDFNSLSVALRETSQFFSYIANFASGDSEEVGVVSMSTTEPVVTVAVVVASGLAILKLYDKILDSARRTIDFWSGINTFKVHNEVLRSLNVEDLIRAETERQVREALSKIKSPLSLANKTECENKIVAKANKVSRLVERGLRIDVSRFSGLTSMGGEVAEEIKGEISNLTSRANELSALLDRNGAVDGLLPLAEREGEDDAAAD